MLVSALRLTLGLATLPLFGFGLLVIGAEARLARRNTQPEPTAADEPPPDGAEHPSVPFATRTAAGEPLPERREVEAALDALTQATLPRKARGRPAKRQGA